MSPEEIGATLQLFLDAGALMATAATPDVLVVASVEEGLTLETADMPMAVPLDISGAAPLTLPFAPKALPAFAVDVDRGEVNAPLGGLEHHVDCVAGLAATLGAPAVALVQFPTLDEETPFAISARDGEGVVLVIGDDQYEWDASG